MATTTAGSLQADVEAYLAQEVLPIAQKVLVLHGFGQKFKLTRGHGTNMTFTRYNRLPLPSAPLAEGAPAIAQVLTIQQVIGTAQQWGGQVTLTDVAELTIFHNPFQKAKQLLGYQLAETLDRNDFLTCMGGTQVNYVNSRGSRANLVAGDVLDPFTIMRTFAALDDIKAPMMMGPPASQVHINRNLREGQPRAGADPRSTPHYVAVTRTFPIQDLRQNPTVSNAWSFSDINKLYNGEVGEWSSIRFCSSNMVPSFTGVSNAGISPTAGAAGLLAANTYFVQLTGSDTQNQYESRIYQVSTGVVVGSGTGSISITTPNIAGFTFNAYIGTTASVFNLATSASGPTTGPMAGQAVQLQANTAIVLTNIGLAQTPPAAPATGVTVYPVFVFGEDAFGVIEMEGGNVEWHWLNQPDKSDPSNQLRIGTWKAWSGAMLLNSTFMCRIECASAFSPTFG